MPSVARLTLVLVAALSVAACGSEPKKGKDQRTAAGQILPGSISDAMLPYDTVRSQPPLAPKETGKAGTKGADSSEDVPGDPAGDPVDLPPAAPVEASAAPAAPPE